MKTTVTDVDLMKMAAKAAKYKLDDTLDGYPLWVEGQGIWNPLTDDGDAFRLAVKLDIDVDFELYAETNDDNEYWEGIRIYARRWTIPHLEVYERERNDKLAATRRAIVRAAAEIGKATGEQQ